MPPERGDYEDRAPPDASPELASALDRADPVAFHELTAQFHLHVGPQTTQHFFASHRIHRNQLPQKLISRPFLFVPAPTDTDRKQETDPPKDDRSQGNVGQYHKLILPRNACVTSRV